jgi:hypothetical protein
MKNLIILLALALCSCRRDDDPEIVAANKKNFAAPVTVGTLPDGRKVKMVVRERAWHEHYIYFVDKAVTVNHEVQSGKQVYNEAEATIK